MPRHLAPLLINRIKGPVWQPLLLDLSCGPALQQTFPKQRKFYLRPCVFVPLFPWILFTPMHESILTENLGNIRMRHTENFADFLLCPACHLKFEDLGDIGRILGRYPGSRQSKLMLSGIYCRFFPTQFFSDFCRCIASVRKISLEFHIFFGCPPFTFLFHSNFA